MRIYTRKVRGMKLQVEDAAPLSIGYKAERRTPTSSGYIPCVEVRVTGADGTHYYMSLFDADIQAINKARTAYDKYFSPPL